MLQARRTFSIILPALTLALLGVGCSFLTTPSPALPAATVTSAPQITPTPPAGFTIHTGSSFQIALPVTWREQPFDDVTIKSRIDAASADNPHLADLLRGMLASGQNKTFLFYAESQTSGPVITNISISRTTIPADETVEQVVREYSQALPQVLKGAKLISFDTPININGQSAGEIVYDLPLVNPGGQVLTLRGVQYLIQPHTSQPELLTITGDSAAADQIMPLARLIGNSFLDIAK